MLLKRSCTSLFFGGINVSEYILSINNVTKKINSTIVIKNVSLNIKKGEIFGLLGPNGAGKTTLIKMIVGLYRIDSGSIVINGYNQKTNLESYLESIGAIVENPDLHNYMSGWENLKQFSRMHKDISNKNIIDMVKMVGLSNSIHKKVKTYSLGMKQRLGIAQAMLHKPKLLILDEPTNGLDPSGVHQLRKYLNEISENGTTILISSHLLAEMQNLCHRVGIIQKGQVIKISNVENFIETDYLITTYYFEDQNNLKKAVTILNNSFSDLEFEVINNAGLKIINLDKKTLFAMNKYFIKNEIDILEIINKKKSLEDKYLELTSHGENENEKTFVASSQ